MRIGILTGAGDVPGLNPATKTVAYRGESEGHEMIGIRRGGCKHPLASLRLACARVGPSSG